MKIRFFRESIYTKFLIQLLFLAFIPITLVILIFSYIAENASSKYELNDQVTDSIVANISNNLEFTARATQSLLSSSELTAFLNNSYSMEEDCQNYISSIQSYIQATINADPRSSIYIYMNNPSIPMSMDVFYHLSDIAKETSIADFLADGQAER